MNFIKKLISFIVNYLKNIFMAKKILFSQDLVTDPSGYRIAIGKNTEEDTKNFDAEALSNIRVKKYDFAWDDSTGYELAIPVGAVIWDAKLSISSAFNQPVDFAVGFGLGTELISWIGVTGYGFKAPDDNVLPALKLPVEYYYISITLGGTPPTQGEASVYVHYSVLD